MRSPRSDHDEVIPVTSCLGVLSCRCLFLLGTSSASWNAAGAGVHGLRAKSLRQACPVAGIFYGPRDSNRTPRVACPAGRDEFIAALRRDEAITVYEDRQFAFLVTTGYSPQRKPNRFYDYKFDKLPIKLKVIQRERPGSRQLSEPETQKVTAEILRNARGVEILWAIGNSPEAPCPSAEEITIVLELETRQLSASGPESVVAFLRATPCADDLVPSYFSDVTQLIYGEIANGAYAMKWDSPLLYAPSAWISYKDLRGDGTEEIVIWPSKVEEAEQWREDDDFGYFGGAVAFDLEGHELTHGALCSEYYAFPDDRVCPIQADKLALVPAKAGKQLDIIATDWSDDHWRGLNGIAHRLHLINQHYEPEPVPASDLPPAPVHTEKLPAKDVGLLLGLRLGGGASASYFDFMYGVYRTLWIARVAEVKIIEAPNLLLPRCDGFWSIGSSISSRKDKKEEFIWRSPLGKQISVHELSETEAESLPEKEVVAHPIQFLAPEYLGVAKAEYEHVETLYTYKIDDSEFHDGLKISTVLGKQAASRLLDEKPKGEDLDVPVSMQYSCEVEVEPVNWSLARKQGHWFVRGWGPVGGNCTGGAVMEYLTTIRAPASLVGFDELPVTWAQVTKAIPAANDAFGAPTLGPSGGIDGRRSAGLSRNQKRDRQTARA